MIRFLGYLFALLALATLGLDIWRGPMQGEPIAFTSTAEYWASFHRDSLIGLNSFVEKSLSPGIWDLALLPALSWPAFILAAVLAFVFSLFAGRR